jgi:hypothetical protein
VRTRWVKPLVFLLVAAQLLLAAPVNTFSRVLATDSSSHACDTMTPAADPGHCPCCPDGPESMNDCLATCVLGAAAVAMLMAEFGAGMMTEAQVFYAPRYNYLLGVGFLKLDSDVFTGNVGVQFDYETRRWSAACCRRCWSLWVRARPWSS